MFRRLTAVPTGPRVSVLDARPVGHAVKRAKKSFTALPVGTLNPFVESAPRALPWADIGLAPWAEKQPRLLVYNNESGAPGYSTNGLRPKDL